MPITVSIVEDSSRTRSALVALLSGETGIHCLRSYASGEDALAGIPTEIPDVVLVDINLPGMSGIECLAKLKSMFPKLQSVVLTTYMDTDLIFNALRAGARGYLLKKRPSNELVEAIKQVHAGGAPMSMQVAGKVIDHFYQLQPATQEAEKLSPREQELLALLAEGYLYKEIADRLGITIGTVRTHVEHVYSKLQVHTRMDAAAKYYGRGRN